MQTRKINLREPSLNIQTASEHFITGFTLLLIELALRSLCRHTLSPEATRGILISALLLKISQLTSKPFTNLSRKKPSIFDIGTADSKPATLKNTVRY